MIKKLAFKRHWVTVFSDGKFEHFAFRIEKCLAFAYVPWIIKKYLLHPGKFEHFAFRIEKCLAFAYVPWIIKKYLLHPGKFEHLRLELKNV